MKKKNEEIVFNSRAITEALEKDKDIFYKFEERLNRISDDIKNLEKYLSQNAVNIPFELVVSDTEKLSWLPFETNGKFRVVYLSFKNNLSRPLIECKIEIRERMYSLLPNFLSGFAKYVNNKK